MAIKIYENNQSTKKSLTRFFTVQPKFSRAQLNLVNIYFSETGRGDLTLAGIDFAHKLLRTDPNTPVILYGSADEVQMTEIAEMAGLIATGRVSYIGIITRLNDIWPLYQKLMAGSVADPLLVARGQDTRYHRIMGEIHHSFYHPDMRQKQIERARQEFGLSGTDAVIAQIIKNYDYNETKKPGKHGGQHWPGVFCDVEQTLLVNGAPNDAILRYLRQLETQGKLVRLWTGGDVNALRQELTARHINWPLLSKFDFSGATVEMAIDDESLADIAKKYGIGIKKFIPAAIIV